MLAWLLAVGLTNAAVPLPGPAVQLERHLAVSPAGQQAARLASPWMGWKARNPGWWATLDESTHTALHAHGPPIAVEDVRAWLFEHADLWGIEGAILRETRRTVALDDVTVVQFAVVHDRARVWRGDVIVYLRQGRVFAVRSGSPGPVPRLGRHELSSDDAARIALQSSPLGFVPHDTPDVRAGWRPVDTPSGVSLQPIWQVRAAGANAGWMATLDAATGEIVAIHDRALYADGTLQIEHGLREGLATGISPLEEATLTLGGASTLTDAAGAWTLPGTGVANLELIGPFAHVVDVRQSTMVTPLLQPTDLIDDRYHSIDARSVWAALHALAPWARTWAPTNPWVLEPVPADVHVTGTCNAWFDYTSGLHFQSSAGTSCRSMATIPDMVAHEWAHGLHYHAMTSGLFDPMLSEGAADLFSYIQSGDPVVAPDYFQNPSHLLRNIDHNRRWATHFSVRNSNHDNGLLYAGSMYDAHRILIDEIGEPAADDALSRVFSGMLTLGPALFSSHNTALITDDDDGDLSNGTPHGCALTEGFAIHGFGAAGAGWFDAEPHVPPSPAADAPIRFDFPMTPVISGCSDRLPATLHWQVDDRTPRSRIITTANRAFRATIPAEPAGTVISYWLSVEDPTLGTVTLPAEAPMQQYSLVVGDMLEVSCNDFEGQDGGYTHALLAGNEGVGADDWGWGGPIGRNGDPDRDQSDGNVWGNDIGARNFDGAYQNGKHNRLSSPPLDLAHYTDPMLRYRRWLTVEDGLHDQARILEDGAVIWSNHVGDGTQHTLDTAWSDHHLPLTAAGARVQLQFELQSNDSEIFGGWNLDDVCILAPDTPDNRLGITGIQAIPRVPGIEVTWTQPRHAPVERVVVVRHPSHIPTGPFDGVMVHEDVRPKLGERAGVFDRTAPRGGMQHYAVFATDGTDWLSWSEEGFNAVSFFDPFRP